LCSCSKKQHKKTNSLTKKLDSSHPRAKRPSNTAV